MSAAAHTHDVVDHNIDKSDKIDENLSESDDSGEASSARSSLDLLESADPLHDNPPNQAADNQQDEDDDGWVRDPQNPEEMSKWSGQPSIKGTSEAMRMALLTCSTIGITFVWGIEQTYCTPYLLSLGLTKSKTSLVWIAGPLSGMMTQPVVGAIADESMSRWGRRRPFIVVGSVIAALCLMLLGFTREIIDLFITDEPTAKQATIVAAVFSIYLVDFAVNAVMSAARSLVVDTLPISKQQTGSAWGGRMSAIGHGLAYGTGAVDLPGIFGTTFGDTQFKQLTIFAAIGIIFFCFLTSWAVEERILLELRHDPNKKRGKFHVPRQILSTLRHCPPRIRAICTANFWAWIGWFPFLFYSTTWIGETYFRYDAPEKAKTSRDSLGDIGRVGSQAFIIYSMLTFSGSWILPMLIKSPDDGQYTARPPESIKKIVETLNRFKPDLLTAWMCAHATFAGAMFFAPFAHSFRFATVLVCLCALPWTIAIWAPPAFLGVEVNKLSGVQETAGSYRRLSDASDVEMARLDEPRPSPKAGASGELSGIYFGILNIYTTVPQFIGTIISMVVFAILEPGKSPELSEDQPDKVPEKKDGPNAVAVCLFIGAIGACFAIFATRKLKYL